MEPSRLVFAVLLEVCAVWGSLGALFVVSWLLRQGCFGSGGLGTQAWRGDQRALLGAAEGGQLPAAVVQMERRYKLLGSSTLRNGLQSVWRQVCVEDLHVGCLVPARRLRHFGGQAVRGALLLCLAGHLVVQSVLRLRLGHMARFEPALLGTFGAFKYDRVRAYTRCRVLIVALADGPPRFQVVERSCAGRLPGEVLGVLLGVVLVNLTLING